MLREGYDTSYSNSSLRSFPDSTHNDEKPGSNWCSDTYNFQLHQRLVFVKIYWRSMILGK